MKLIELELIELGAGKRALSLCNEILIPIK